MKFYNTFMLVVLLLLNTACAEAQQKESLPIDSTLKTITINTVSTLNITTLSTMLVSTKGIGEWGYSSLVEVDGKKILFDTGRRPETVLRNAEDLNIDLSDVEDVFLSHNHGDHTGGLLTLRAELKKQNPKAMSRIHVGKGIFSKRANFRNRMLELKEELEADGVTFIIYDDDFELFPGVWITGPIERIHDEKNWSGNGQIETENGLVEDNIPEDQSLVICTKGGTVMIAGCGHAGVINTLEHIKSNIHEGKTSTVIGGLHLVQASDEHLKWTADELQKFGVTQIMGAHCTGINALYTLRDLLNLSRKDAVVGAVGDRFDLENGVRASIIAK